jgi:hypothetical protein
MAGLASAVVSQRRLTRLAVRREVRRATRRDANMMASKFRNCQTRLRPECDSDGADIPTV